jgi:two-component system, chemotaxis family, protein-glutamate methylesterase/glutaminase
VAIGASAGGVEALAFLITRLPNPFPATMLITLHLSQGSELDQILNRAANGRAAFAQNGDTLRKGHIFIAPPGHHLIANGETLLLGSGPRESHAKPAIDPMLRSVAACCGPRTVGVVLTGTLGDGASGLNAIQQCGGMTVVQDPNDAAHPEMPRAAMNESTPDHIVRLVDLPMLLTSLVHQPAGQPRPVPESIRFEVSIASGEKGSMRQMDRLGQRSILTCPECNGLMWEIDEGNLVRYRCHVGHAYSEETMSIGLDGNLRRALASALRLFEERVALLKKLDKQARESGHKRAAHDYNRKKDEYEVEAEVIRETIGRLDTLIDSEAQ